MYCQLCGEEIDAYDISCRQQIGIEADGVDGVPIEAQRFTSTGICSRCGTTSYAEYINYDEVCSISYDDCVEENFTRSSY